MSETVEQLAVLKSPLHEAHLRLGATMSERDGWSVPQSYGDVGSEYAAVREDGSGVIDLSNRGRILVSGTEAVQFLNGLITNDMKTLAEHSWMPAAFPNVQGRLIASVRIVHLGDHGITGVVNSQVEGTDRNVCPTFLIDTEAATHARVLKTIERFTLAGDFRVMDITSQTAHITLQGKNAVQVARAVFGLDFSELAPTRANQINWVRSDGTVTADLTVVRATHTAEDGFDFVVKADEANNLWEALQGAGAQAVGYDALETLRIEAGLPRYGVDMDESNVVTETTLDDAVSYTKGCYIGQEIIARIKYRGHVAKKLAGLAFEQTAKVEAGAIIKSSDDKEVGRITSVTDSPRLRRTIALGYLKYDYLAPRTSVKIIAGAEELPAQVTELPFVRGSWSKERLLAAD
jgi:folate-binding protein YgfZ